MDNHHDKHWGFHPFVKTGKELSLGDRAADWMRSAFGTWKAVFVILGWMVLWLLTDGFGIDNPQVTILNLILSCIAALQCFIIMISQKRQDAVNAALAQHDRQILKEIRKLSGEIHEHLGIPKE